MGSQSPRGFPPIFGRRRRAACAPLGWILLKDAAILAAALLGTLFGGTLPTVNLFALSPTHQRRTSRMKPFSPRVLLFLGLCLFGLVSTAAAQLTPDQQA